MNPRIANILYFAGGAATAALISCLFFRKKELDIQKDVEKEINRKDQEIGRLHAMIKKQKKELADTDGSIPIVERVPSYQFQRARYEYDPSVIAEDDEEDHAYDGIPEDDDDADDDFTEEDVTSELPPKGYLAIIEEEGYAPLDTYDQIYWKYEPKLPAFVDEEKGHPIGYERVCQAIGADNAQTIIALYTRRPVEYASKTFHVRNSNFRSDYIINLA